MIEQRRDECIDLPRLSHRITWILLLHLVAFFGDELPISFNIVRLHLRI